MDREAMERALRKLGRMLAERGQTGEILAAGGAPAVLARGTRTPK